MCWLFTYKTSYIRTLSFPTRCTLRECRLTRPPIPCSEKCSSPFAGRLARHLAAHAIASAYRPEQIYTSKLSRLFVPIRRCISQFLSFLSIQYILLPGCLRRSIGTVNIGVVPVLHENGHTNSRSSQRVADCHWKISALRLVTFQINDSGVCISINTRSTD